MEVYGRMGGNMPLGLDSIPEGVLKLVTKARPNLFTNTLVAYLKEGIFLVQWKMKKMVLVPNHNKPPRDPAFDLLAVHNVENEERVIYNRLSPTLYQTADIDLNEPTVDAINTVASLLMNTLVAVVSCQHWV